MSVEIIHGDCRAILPALPERSVQTCVTSPPYWGLRDYGLGCEHKTAVSNFGHKGIITERNEAGDAFRNSTRYVNQPTFAPCDCPPPIGLEPTPELYVEHIVECFRAVRRVLRDDGTVWLNLGDSYNSTPSWGRGGGHNLDGGLPRYRPGAGRADGIVTEVSPRNRDGVCAPGLKPKDLVGIPWRVAFALQADGWWLRSDIIWAKPNPMPESCRDRPTRAHEYVFLLSKSARYFWDADAIREPSEDVLGTERFKGRRGISREDYEPHTQGWNGTGLKLTYRDYTSGRNKRTVWTIATQPSSIRHFATFPEALVKPCIQAGTSERGQCPECGKPWVREMKRTAMQIDRTNNHPPELRTRTSGTMTAPATSRTTGWRPTCAHEGEPVPQLILDPFSGSGTVGVVAKRAGRRAILIEASAEYCELAERRIGSQGVLL